MNLLFEVSVHNLYTKGTKPVPSDDLHRDVSCQGNAWYSKQQQVRLYPVDRMGGPLHLRLLF